MSVQAATDLCKPTHNTSRYGTLLLPPFPSTERINYRKGTWAVLLMEGIKPARGATRRDSTQRDHIHDVDDTALLAIQLPGRQAQRGVF